MNKFILTKPDKKIAWTNSDYLFFEVFDYLNCQIMSKAHAGFDVSINTLLLTVFEIVEVSKNKNKS